MWGHSLQHIIRDAGDDDATKEALSERRGELGLR